MEWRRRNREKGERSSLQSKHEGKMLVGSSPGSCTPMQVQVNIHHCCTREVSMNRQLHPTTSPPGLDRRELFGLLVVFVAFFFFFLLLLLFFTTSSHRSTIGHVDYCST